MRLITASHQEISPLVSTCKLIADLVPRVLGVGLTGWGTVLLQVLLQIPAFGFIECVEQKGELLHRWLCMQGPVLTDNQRSNQTGVKVPLLEYEIRKMSFSSGNIHQSNPSNFFVKHLLDRLV